MAAKMERNVSMKIQTLIFDWDGTLHNTERLYGAALRKTIRWLQSGGYTVPGNPSDLSDARFRRYLGVNARDMWNDFLPDLPNDLKEECSRRTGIHMNECIENGMAELYPGAPELLRSLRDRGYHLVILSNCKVPYMAAQRANFGLDEYFDAYYCSGAYDFAPKEDIFPEIAAKFPGEYLMIGDRSSDRRVAEIHGIHFLGCAYGFGELDEIQGGDGILTALADLSDKLADLQSCF